MKFLLKSVMFVAVIVASSSLFAQVYYKCTQPGKEGNYPTRKAAEDNGCERQYIMEITPEQIR